MECSYNVDENIGTYVHDNNSGAGPGAESNGGEETTGGRNGDNSEKKWILGTKNGRMIRRRRQNFGKKFGRT